ncbi:hypothetical protein GBAR_LOCUS24354 [Geodia barretti]|uniref:Uncharacterized protein n=1 Tax=Geodia barretti TaxID=519541 RepID=A0AA35T9K6_GEOBA|nr:hypothetical protein GBAR_LOCUS24354 [Geodia barretti]
MCHYSNNLSLCKQAFICHLSMFAVYIAPIHVSSLYVKALEVVHRQVTLGSHVREGREHVATVSPTRTRWVSQE